MDGPAPRQQSTGKHLTLGSLFSGVGGFELGFQRAGFDVRWQVEIGTFPTRVLERHWPDVRRYTDVREVDPAALEPVDVVTFGSPCQDLSVAGKRAGLNGARSGLFYKAARIIGGLRPRPAFAVWENVPGSLSSHQGRDFAAVLDALADAGAVDLCWRVLDSRWFGVPQRRRRVFLVADFGAHRAGQVLLEPQSRRRHPAPRPEARAGLAGGPSGGAGGGSRASYAYDDTAYSLTARQTRLAGEDTYVPVTSPALRAEGHDASEDGNGRRALIAYGVSEAPTPKVGEDVMPTFGANHGGGGRRDAIAFAWQQGDDSKHGANGRGRSWVARAGDYTGALSETRVDAVCFGEEQGGHVYENPVTNALSQNGGKPGQGYQAVRLGTAVRRLTPTEAERLQGFPDGFTCLCGVEPYSTAACRCPDSPRYSALGNAVTVNVALWLAVRLAALLTETPVTDVTPATSTTTQ